jgi:hypothetical protein
MGALYLLRQLMMYSPNFKDVNLQAYSAIIEEHPLCVFDEVELNRCAVVTSRQRFLDKIKVFLSCRS